MANEAEAVFNVRVKMNTEEIDQALAKSLAQIEAIEARVASGAQTPAAGQAEIATIASQAYAQQQVQGVDTAVGRANTGRIQVGVIKAAEAAYVRLAEDVSQTSKNVRAFNRNIAVQGGRLYSEGKAPPAPTPPPPVKPAPVAPVAPVAPPSFQNLPPEELAAVQEQFVRRSQEAIDSAYSKLDRIGRDFPFEEGPGGERVRSVEADRQELQAAADLEAQRRQLKREGAGQAASLPGGAGIEGKLLEIDDLITEIGQVGGLVGDTVQSGAEYRDAVNKAADQIEQQTGTADKAATDQANKEVTDAKKQEAQETKKDVEDKRQTRQKKSATEKEQERHQAELERLAERSKPANLEETAKAKLDYDLARQKAANAVRRDPEALKQIAGQEADDRKYAAQEEIAIQQALKNDTDYAGYAAQAAAAKKKHAAAIEALVQQELAGVGGATDADRRRIKAESDRYVSDLARAKAFKQSTEARVGVQSTQQLLDDPSYVKDKAKEGANSARLQAQENVLLARALEQDQEYLANTARASASRKRQAAAIENAAQRELAGAGISPSVKAASERYVKNLAEASAFRQQTQARVDLGTQAQLTADPAYAQNRGELAALRQRQQVQEGLVMEAVLAADKDLAAETGKLAALRRSRQIAERQSFLAQQDVRAEGQLAFREDFNKSAIGVEKIRARDEDPLLAARSSANQAAIAVDEYKQSMAKKAALANLSVKDEEEIRQNQATVKVAEKERTLAVNQMVRTKLGTAFLEREIQEEVAQQAAAETKRSSVLAAQLAQDEAYFRTKGQNLVQAKVLAERERAAASMALQEQIKSGAVARGSFVQRVQQRVATRTGGAVRLPQDFATGPQLLQGAAVTTARFALSGAALYGGFAVLSKAIKEAQELEKIFNQIRRQFESLGRSDQFEGFRTQILAIARETGAAGAEVANVGFQLQGAFGGDTGRALRETESAFKAVRVTGLSITEVIDAFTALTENFDNSGVTIESVSDKALGLQERFGVLAKETIAFSSDLAPVAAQAGFTVEQLEALGAVGQKYSGRSGTSLAEAFGRILPSIQGNAVEFTQLFQQIGDADIAGQVTEAFREGNISAFFEILLRQYSSLSDAQKNYVIELLGGRREAQALIPILENSGELLREFGESQQDVGKTSEYFGDLQKTLTQQVAELGETFTQLGVQIYASGLKDFLEDIVNLASLAVDALSGLVGVVSALGGALGSIPGVGGGLTTLIEGLLVFKGIGALGGLLSRRGAAPAGAAVAPRVIPGVAGVLPAAPVAGQGLRTSITSSLTGGTLRSAVAAGGFGGAATQIGSGIKTAMVGFNWAGLGATVGLLAATEISGGIKSSAQKRIAELVGPDNRASEKEIDRLGGEFGQTSEGISRLYQQILENGGTFADFRKALLDQAEEDTSSWQDFLEGGQTLGLNFSQDSQENRGAVNAISDEYKTAIAEDLEALASNEELLSQLSQDTTILDPEFGTVKTRVNASGSKTIEPGKTEADALTLTRERVNGIIEALQNGEDVPLDELAFLQEAMVLAARKIELRATEQVNAVEEQALAVLEADEALALFDAGEIGSTQAQQALSQAVATRQSLGFGTGSAEQRKELADLIKREKEFQSEVLLKEAQALVGVLDDFGGSPQQQLDTYTNLLRSGRLTPKDYATASDEAFDLLQAVFDAKKDAADSAAKEAQLFATGIPVPQELQLARAYEFLQTGSIAYQEFLFVASSGLQEYAETITWTAADLYSKGNISMTEAIRKSIEAQIWAVAVMKQTAITNLKKAARLGDPVNIAKTTAKYDAQLAALTGSLATIPEIDVPDFGTFGKDPAAEAAAAARAAEEANQAREEAAQKAHDIRVAELELQKARVEGDPLREAQLDLQIAQENERFAASQGDRAGQLNAQAEQIRANRAAEEARSGIYLAQSELGAAVRGDPIGDAYNEVIIANEAIRLARGTAERLSAQAQKVRAERSLAEAFQDIAIANLELAQAFADAAGDSVKSAEIALNLARQQLGDIRRNSPNDQAAILRAQANVVSQEAALRDADLAERQRAIDVALQLEQITTQQAIQQLQALLTLPGLTKEQIDNLLIKIKQMKDELGQDFQFNLPTVFGLPTAYEARRVDQTLGGSGDYNDNRTITVTVNASTDADPAAIATTVAAVIGEPNRTGTVPKRF